jgi:hypothetical protein
VSGFQPDRQVRLKRVCLKTDPTETCSDTSVFFYRNGAMVDLNQAIDKDASGIWPMISGVSAINDRGQIVGSAYLAGSQGNVGIRACLLTPVAPNQ